MSRDERGQILAARPSGLSSVLCASGFGVPPYGGLHALHQKSTHPIKRQRSSNLARLVWGLGFGVCSLWVGVWGFGFRVSDFGFRVWPLRKLSWLRLATQDCHSREAMMGRELMAPRTNRTTRISSSVASPVTANPKGPVLVNLRNNGRLKNGSLACRAWPARASESGLQGYLAHNKPPPPLGPP